LLVLYLIYFICRILFFLFNHSFFEATGISEFLKISFYGLRFDSFSIFALNSLFILLSIIPGSHFFRKKFQKALKIIFISTNTIGILLNSIDYAYFPFIKKRSGADLIHQVGGQTDMAKLLPQYVKDFWWVLMLVLFTSLLMTFLYKRIKVEERKYPEFTLPNTFLTLLIFLFCSGVSVLALRGGTQRYPIDIINAGEYASPELVPLVLNTPFTLIKSIGQEELIAYEFFSEGELKKRFNPIHKFDSVEFKKKNVIILILESFAKEYTALGKTKKSYTPFLDSLCKHSFVFTNGFANGSKSIEGIPAILSGLPHLMENPFINSAYSNNYQTSFASILKPEGYTTAFFHGGTNGTMNFDTYSKLAGYDHYFGRNEYDNDDDFDGFWGIWDEPYLQYTVRKMDELNEPFHSSVFTLSSHHPYQIPEKYKGKFPTSDLDNIESVGYSDYALKLFFEKAKKSKWYKNSLFVLCADHTSLSDHSFYKNIVGQQAIPIIFFSPDESLTGEDSRSFSQCDILPSVLNLLSYNKSFFAFGQSYLQKKNNNCYYYVNGNHLMIADSIMLSFNKASLQSVYNFKRDSTLATNIKGKYTDLEEQLSDDFKSFIQSHNLRIRENQMRLK
jgi:phosphoglycerol transferase MdoB-like AlkP superfamily enzyme